MKAIEKPYDILATEKCTINCSAACYVSEPFNYFHHLYRYNYSSSETSTSNGCGETSILVHIKLNTFLGVCHFYQYFEG